MLKNEINTTRHNTNLPAVDRRQLSFFIATCRLSFTESTLVTVTMLDKVAMIPIQPPTLVTISCILKKKSMTLTEC